MKRGLSPRRFRHTVSVARLAKRLAALHGEDPARAWRAGLLHDCAKEWPGRRLAQAVRRRRLRVPGLAFIRRYRRLNLLHAYVSADEARRTFGVRDRALSSAIAKHTLADRRMNRLDKIVYVADFASPDRGRAARRSPSFEAWGRAARRSPRSEAWGRAAGARVRRLARKDLNAAFRSALQLKLLHTLHKGDLLHPAAVDAWNEQFV